MTTLNRIVISYGGTGVVGAAVTVLHYDGSDNAAPPVAAIKNAWYAAKDLFPIGTTITVPGTGDRIDDTTGELTGVWAAPGGEVITGNGGDGCAAGVGACIGWSTGGIVNGRKLRGRTFVVPLFVGHYGTDGTIKDTVLPTIGTLGNALMAAGPLAVWHRPTSKGAGDGTSYGVIASKVRDKVAFLSSRRD